MVPKCYFWGPGPWTKSNDEGAKEQKRAILASLKWGRGGPDVPFILSKIVVHHRVTPSIEFGGTHLYTWVERVKCLAHEHHAMCPAKARTQTARSGVERTQNVDQINAAFPFRNINP